jgi:hypothetical protein
MGPAAIGAGFNRIAFDQPQRALDDQDEAPARDVVLEEGRRAQTRTAEQTRETERRLADRLRNRRDGSPDELRDQERPLPPPAGHGGDAGPPHPGLLIDRRA